jgi:hypothetical protein
MVLLEACANVAKLLLARQRHAARNWRYADRWGREMVARGQDLAGGGLRAAR